MSHRTGPMGDGFESAVSALAARSEDLAEADRELGRLLGEAHAIAIAAIGRLARIEAQLETAVNDHAVDSPLEGREFSRLLLSKNREIIDVVARARSEVDAKTVELQQMIDRYRRS